MGTFLASTGASLQGTTVMMVPGGRRSPVAGLLLGLAADFFFAGSDGALVASIGSFWRCPVPVVAGHGLGRDFGGGTRLTFGTPGTRRTSYPRVTFVTLVAFIPFVALGTRRALIPLFARITLVALVAFFPFFALDALGTHGTRRSGMALGTLGSLGTLPALGSGGTRVASRSPGTGRSHGPSGTSGARFSPGSGRTCGSGGAPLTGGAGLAH